MNRAIALATAVFAAGLSFGEDAPIKFRKDMTPAERQAWHNQLRLRRTGGTIREAGSAKGMFVVLNAQKRVPAESLKEIVKILDETVLFRSAIIGAEAVTVANVGEKVRAAGGTVGVGLVDDANLPTLLAAPETGWAVVNVAKLAEKCPDKAVLAARVRKEILRSLAFTAGGAYATLADPLMRDVTNPGDLDALQPEEFGVEMINRFWNSSTRYGLKR